MRKFIEIFINILILCLLIITGGIDMGVHIKIYMSNETKVSVDETLRMVDALQFFEENGEVCPAEWHKGDEAIKETQESIASYLSK